MNGFVVNAIVFSYCRFYNFIGVFIWRALQKPKLSHNPFAIENSIKLIKLNVTSTKELCQKLLDIPNYNNANRRPINGASNTNKQKRQFFIRKKSNNKKTYYQEKDQIKRKYFDIFRFVAKVCLSFVFDYCKMNSTAFISWCHRNDDPKTTTTRTTTTTTRNQKNKTLAFWILFHARAHILCAILRQ